MRPILRNCTFRHFSIRQKQQRTHSDDKFGRENQNKTKRKQGFLSYSVDGVIVPGNSKNLLCPPKPAILNKHSAGLTSFKPKLPLSYQSRVVHGNSTLLRQRASSSKELDLISTLLQSTDTVTPSLRQKRNSISRSVIRWCDRSKINTYTHTSVQMDFLERWEVAVLDR